MSNLLYKHYAHGKLLLSGEYFVLDGAKAFAVPTRYGQLFKVYQVEKATAPLVWKSYNHQNKIWLEVHFNVKNKVVEIAFANDEIAAKKLQILLNTAFKQTEQAIEFPLEISTHLEFPNHWGLGSSSTLVTSVAKWLRIDPFELLDSSFGGSGYDVACASADLPLFYQKRKGKIEINEIDLNFSFSDHIYFVHLNKKQSSDSGIEHYKKTYFEDKQELVSILSGISEGMAHSHGIEKFMNYMFNHECVIANNLHMEKVQDLYFSDFNGVIKSLGAWGGDFVMAVSKLDEQYVQTYFEQKGFTTIIPYHQMILNHEMV
jgi:mevalonate kinase